MVCCSPACGLSVSHFLDLAESSGGRLPTYGSQWGLSILIASFGIVLFAAIAGWLIHETIAALLAQAAMAAFMVFSAFYADPLPHPGRHSGR